MTGDGGDFGSKHKLNHPESFRHDICIQYAGQKSCTIHKHLWTVYIPFTMNEIGLSGEFRGRRTLTSVATESSPPSTTQPSVTGLD